MLTALSIGVAIGMLGVGAMVMFDARNDAWNEAEQASTNLSIALERDIARNVGVYDLSLQGAVGAVRLAGIDQVSPEIRHMAMFDQAANAEFLGALLIIDAAGNVVADSTSIVPHELNLAAEEYFYIHRQLPDVGLFVSRPFVNQMMGGETTVAISRRLSGEDGKFHGVVMGALRLAFFEHLFQDLNLGPDGAMTIFRTDGRVIANYPSQAKSSDLDLGDSTIFAQIAGKREGNFVAPGPFDGISRLYTFRRVGDLPLVLSIGISVKGVYAAWRHKAVIISVLLGLLSGTTVILCMLFRHEMSRRIEAETALVGAAQELTVIASTDALTGLLNRRAFETALDVEWRRVGRGSQQIALLMLDADNYKLYNDHYGHQEGDRALQVIAESIRKSLFRPADIGARYGGEEFVVLLPDTGYEGALSIAEAIRDALAIANLPHVGSAFGRLTLSIGLAIANPTEIDAKAVIKEADEALYVAKKSGRNRVSVAPGSVPADQPVYQTT